MKPLRLGIVGCGAVTELYHLPAIAASGDVELVALADPATDRATSLGRANGNPRVYADHRELVGVVDVAIVAAPNRLHAPIACDLAAAGVHVLVEKPLARTAAECDVIAAAARSAGVVIAVGHDFRHFPVASVARELFSGGLLGEIQSAELLQSAAGRWPYASAYVYSREESGGGVLIDFGVHMLDLLGWWLGELTARAYADDTVAGVETECELSLETTSGAPVGVQLTRLRPMRDTTIVRCEHATVEIGIFEPAVIRITLPGGGTLAGGVPDTLFDAAPLRTVFGRQLADFARAVRSGGEPLVPVSEGRRVVELVERCYGLRTPLRRAWDWPEAYSGLEETA
ncbi:MAG: Gfo/Idh/MocA family oxidoreductase [Actinobacteria bacterium]|nr:Gfo/Idh/MocA family oxidoreductase [Actinomycetota bacterium]